MRSFAITALFRQPESYPAHERHGGGRKLVDTFPSTMDLLPGQAGNDPRGEP